MRRSRATTTNCCGWKICCRHRMPGPEAMYARDVLLDELELAFDELPDEQREVFVAHELEGRSFKEMAAETGVSVNTLLVAQTLRGAAPARAVAEHLRRVDERVRN